MTIKQRRRMVEAVTRLFEKLCSVKFTVFAVFVGLRLAEKVSAEQLTGVAMAIVGVNSGMKIYHGLMRNAELEMRNEVGRNEGD